jgi:sugar lactone lactonase YvrE
VVAGLTAFEWVLVGSYAVGLALVVESRRCRPAGASIGGVLLVPVLAGIAILAFLIGKHYESSRQAAQNLADRGSAIALALSVLLIALAIVDGALTRVVPAMASLLARLGGPPRLVSNASLALVLGLLAAGVLLGGPRASDSLDSGEAATALGSTSVVLASHKLPGHPSDIVFTGKGEGYMSYGEGQIVHFSLPEGPAGRLELRTVARDRPWPRGLAVMGRTLFVSELGHLPCPDPFPRCKGDDVPGLDPVAAETKILRESRGRVVAFDIVADGSLTNERTILSELPFGNTDHGVNDIVAESDGFLDVAIGSLDALYQRPDIAKRVAHPNADLLGTVLRFSPDGRRHEVLVRGLRNVYGLALDGRGRLYGVDNDGPTVGGERREEVLWLRAGADFGYPYAGTFGAHQRRTDGPLWILDSNGSAGIEWAPNLGLSPGLVVGSCGKLERISLTKFGDQELVALESDVTQVLEIPGCVTAVEPGPDRTTFLTVFPFGDSPGLYVVRLAA